MENHHVKFPDKLNIVLSLPARAAPAPLAAVTGHEPPEADSQTVGDAGSAFISFPWSSEKFATANTSPQRSGGESGMLRAHCGLLDPEPDLRPGEHPAAYERAMPGFAISAHTRAIAIRLMEALGVTSGQSGEGSVPSKTGARHPSRRRTLCDIGHPFAQASFGHWPDEAVARRTVKVFGLLATTCETGRLPENAYSMAAGNDLRPPRRRPVLPVFRRTW